VRDFQPGEDYNVLAATTDEEEEDKWSWDGLDEVVRLTTMVAHHTASLPPHAPPLAAWEGQLVSPPQHGLPPPAYPTWQPPHAMQHGVERRRCRLEGVNMRFKNY
jgi:hypothetical protein